MIRVDIGGPFGQLPSTSSRIMLPNAAENPHASARVLCRSKTLFAPLLNQFQESRHPSQDENSPLTNALPLFRATCRNSSKAPLEQLS